MGTILVRFLSDLRLVAKCNLDAVLFLVLFAFFCDPVSSATRRPHHLAWPGTTAGQAAPSNTAPSAHRSRHVPSRIRAAASTPRAIRYEPALCGSIPEWAFPPA